MKLRHDDTYYEKETRKNRKRNPAESANVISFLTFFYTKDIFLKGLKKDLNEDDIYKPCEKHKSKKLGKDLESIWKSIGQEKPSLFNLLNRRYGREYLFMGMTLLLVEVVSLYIVPSSTKKLITYFSPNQTSQSKADAYCNFAIIIVMNIANAIFNVNYSMRVAEMGMKMRSAITFLIYKKSLTLSPSAMQRYSSGKIVSLLTKDVAVLENLLLVGNCLWIGPLEMAVAFYVLYKEFGVATLVPAAFILSMVVVLVLLGKLLSIIRQKACEKADQRLQLTQELLTAIKLIKMYTWEKVFENKILQARKQEVYKLFQLMYLRPLYPIFGMLTHDTSTFLQLVACIWFSVDLSAAKVYFAISVFGMVVFSFNAHGLSAMMQAAQFFASNRRITDFLNAEEIKPQYIAHHTTNPKIEIKDANVGIDDQEILSDLNLELPRGLHIISGKAGCGKSVLLRTILQDYQIGIGSIYVEGSISYAAQEPWLFPGSIKENILFGEVYDKVRYGNVLKVCALELDLRRLEEGDETLVEDNGRNLSKGQQVRVNLARAVYRDSDIYILDDFLSSLDEKVKNHIFNNCFINFLKHKVCVIVCQDEKYAKKGDSKIIMGKGRVIVAANLESSKNMVKTTQSIEDVTTNCNEAVSTYAETDTCVDKNEEVVKEDVNLLTKPKNIYHENKEKGRVKWKTYHQFLKFGGGYILMPLALSMTVVLLLTQLTHQKLIKEWADLENELRVPESFGNTTYRSDGTARLERDTTVKYLWYTMLAYLCIYVINQVFHSVFTALAVWNTHKSMVSKIIRAKMAFFDVNLIGNILNRFSKDLATMEEDLPQVIYKLGKFIVDTVGQFILVVYISRFFMIPVTLLCIVFGIIMAIYLAASRSLRRLEAAARAPVVGHINASLEGVTTIRAAQKGSTLCKQLCDHQDIYTSAYFMSKTAYYTFSLAVEMMCMLFTAAVIGYFLIRDSGTSAGGVGIAITKTLFLKKILMLLIQHLSELENVMTSVERALEYTFVETEPMSPTAVHKWSSQGAITFNHVSLIYPSTHQNTLSDLTFEINPQEKVAIIGRTGAGKSSIISTIFRLYDAGGNVVVNGVDISQLNLQFLRSNITVVPQDPFLFKGSVRENLDPKGNYSDAEIRSAIESVGLKSLIHDLTTPVTSNINLSLGQKQLLCFARAVLQNNSILILDEVVANTDNETSDLVQKLIATKFANCTVLTITHKLSSVLKYDKIMMIDRGTIVEFETTSVLLNNENSRLNKILQEK